MVELLGRNLQLSAIFTYNDSMAAGALTALKDNGILVPQHFSVIGFDDIPMSRYTDPQLTTVRYPIVSMAKLATELALKGAAGELDVSAQHCFMPTLVRRHPSPRGKMWHRSLFQPIPPCNRFQSVSKFTVN